LSLRHSLVGHRHGQRTALGVNTAGRQSRSMVLGKAGVARRRACPAASAGAKLSAIAFCRTSSMTEPVGLGRGLTNYGDPDFALYLRRSFARSMGYSLEMLSTPVIGIADTRSGFNNCHRHFPELIE